VKGDMLVELWQGHVVQQARGSGDARNVAGVVQVADDARDEVERKLRAMLVDGGGRGVLDERRDLTHGVSWWFSGVAVVPDIEVPGLVPGVVPGRARGHAEREWERLHALSTSHGGSVGYMYCPGVLYVV
jgi:hypothetical protein